MPPAVRIPQQGKNAPKGLNENYGRELMELHTLGVDGGYTQKDVTEVARALTGWTIENPRLGGGFRFEPRLHDEGPKVVLGHTIHAGGQNDGEEVLNILARQPATAHFISMELVRRFVSDAPPPALVDRAAARFRETGEQSAWVDRHFVDGAFAVTELLAALAEKRCTPAQLALAWVMRTRLWRAWYSARARWPS